MFEVDNNVITNTVTCLQASSPASLQVRSLNFVPLIADTHAVDAKPSKGEDETKEETKGKEPPPPSVPFYRLFQYADALDVVLMIAGTVGAMVHGAALPVFFLFFGDLTNSLGTGDLGSVTKVR